MANHISDYRVSSIWLPLLVGGLLSLLVILLAWSLKQEQFRQQHDRVRVFANGYVRNVQVDLDLRVPTMQRMVDRWVFRGGTPEDEFVRDAQSHINDFQGFQAIEWVDPTFHVRWIVPLVGNEQAVGLDLAAEPTRLATLVKAKAGRVPVMSDPIELVQGGKGMLIYFPIYAEKRFQGFILSVFRLQDWFAHILLANSEHEHLDSVKFMIEMDGETVYKQSGWSDLKSTVYDVQVDRLVMGHTFTVSCRPAAVFFDDTNTSLPYLTGIAGLIVSFLVGFAIYSFQKASREALITNFAKIALEKEVHDRSEAEALVKRASTRLALATKAGKVGVWEWDVETNELRWDKMMYEIYGLPDDVLPKYESWIRLVAEEDTERVVTLLDQAVKGRVAFETEFRVELWSGVHKHVQAAAAVERDADGKALRMVGVNWDVTERRHAEEDLARERRRLSAIIKGTNVGTWEWNVQTGEVFFNERWANIIGYTLAELEPLSIETWTNCVHPEDLERSGQLLEQHFKGELDYYECQARLKHRSGEWVWVLDRGKVSTWSEDGKPLLMSGTHQDITSEKMAEEQIRHLATHDTLTDLPTLHLAKDRINMALATAKRKKQLAAVLFVDLDGFKNVNDSYGHEAGDGVLRETSARLLGCVRHVDTVARVGGDEFLVILSELQSKEDAGTVADKIVASIDAPYVFEGQLMRVSASVGIAVSNGLERDIESEQLVKSADKAMYTIKKSGKNGYAYADMGEFESG